MGIIYFDICAIPLFLIILFVCYSRKMTKGRANQMFILVVLLSLVSAVTDLGMEVINNMVPLSRTQMILCRLSANIYLLTRNLNNLTLLLFLLVLTRTTFLIRKRRAQITFFLPYTIIVVLLLQNSFTHNVFKVTAQDGYRRGPLILALYTVAAIYGLVGLVYCIYCRRYLPMNKWSALLSIYIVAHITVVIQFFYPKLLLEMFCTALSEMLIMLSIMRPEERMDVEVGMLSWESYQTDLKNIILSGEHVQIIVLYMPHSREIRNYLGDHVYNKYILEIGEGLRRISWEHPHNIEIYYERPGTIYLITDINEIKTENVGERLLAELDGTIRPYTEMGVRFEPKVCLIRCPEDLKKVDDIISLGHKFQKIDINLQHVPAAEIVHSQKFAVEVHIEEILERAIKDKNIVMYYQPIYDVHTGGFHSAEALARLIDPEYGMVSPAVFIPAAETQGFIIPIGDEVLDRVFRFIAENDMDALGLSHIDINLSVAQCMESSLPDKMYKLQEKYGVDAGRINLEITETTFENISDIMVENVNKLLKMGYNFALDDYGIGYSNIQRVNNIPLMLIKIDKSMLDEVSSDNGRVILEHTVHMMQSIGKQIVAEGAETGDEVYLLKNMNCDYIQGFYYSRPLPAAEFVEFLKEQNKKAI